VPRVQAALRSHRTFCSRSASQSSKLGRAFDFRLAVRILSSRSTRLWMPWSNPSHICERSHPPMPETPRSETIAVAMSGGVDSSVVAGMLNARGERVVGLTMQLWNQRRLPEIQTGHPTGRCCSLDDVYDARAVAQHLGIPYYVVNFEDRFENQVVKPF